MDSALWQTSNEPNSAGPGCQVDDCPPQSDWPVVMSRRKETWSGPAQFMAEFYLLDVCCLVKNNYICEGQFMSVKVSYIYL